MDQLVKFIRKCRESESSVLFVLLRTLWYRMQGKNIVANNRVIIKGLKNITTRGPVQIGMANIGFMHKYDRTLLNVRGRLEFASKCTIPKGCRLDIGENAVVRFGEGIVGPNVNFIIMHGLEIGNGFLISWGSQLLDEDFHEIEFEGRKLRDNKIVIGRHVWIGTNVTVLKGSRIPDGCVVAAGSVVTKVFEKENCLIGGNPAKIIKENITWK